MLHYSEPSSELGLPTVWPHWKNPGMARWCREMLQDTSCRAKLTSASSSGSLGFIVCVKCCRVIDSVPRW